MSSYPTNLAKPRQIRTALSIYRVMAFIAGVALVILLVAMFLRYGPPQNETVSKVWSPIHGFLYMGYAAAIANLGLKAGWSLTRIVLNLLTGFVPVLPWIAEARVTRETEAMLQRAYAVPPTDEPDPASADRSAGGSATD